VTKDCPEPEIGYGKLAVENLRMRMSLVKQGYSDYEFEDNE
jgi:hypothetical protein